MQDLESPDIHRLNAAQGWLGLDCPAEARAELDAIAPGQQFHPAVLEVRWMICAHERKWREALAVADRELEHNPDDSSGWLHRAYALRRVDDHGLEEAWRALEEASEKFPTEPVIFFNLACYACQLSKPDEARLLLQRAVKVSSKEAIQEMACADEDLKLLWPEIENW